MFVELDRRGRGSVASKPDFDWVETDGDSIVVRGDDALARDTYLAATDESVCVATSLPELLAHPQVTPVVSREGVSHLLGAGFVPLPLTLFAGVNRLGAGDEVRIAADRMVFTSDYPWVNSKSRQDQVPSTKTLLELMVASVERRLDACGRRGMLMMSSGKDSVGLAVALAELGYDIPCFTYKSRDDDIEHDHAARICRRLGLRHETIVIPRDPARVRAHMLDFFSSAAAPSADHAMIPFIMTVAEAGVRDGGIIDGGGSDGYMGYVRSKRRRRKRKFRIRGRWLQEAVARSTRVDARINYLARGRSASDWPGRNMRIHEISRVLADATNPAEMWREVDRSLAGQRDIDRAMRNMVHQIEGSRTPDKVIRVAESRGMDPILPYCDADLADYCFNLPEEDRFDVVGRKEKLLLRRLLAEKIEYDPAAIGDAFFAFDGAPFFIDNAEFVREEIIGCALWESDVVELVDEWLDALPDRPFLFHALLSLFMVSGWHNHSPVWSGA